MAFYMLSLSDRYILYNTDFYDTDRNRFHLWRNGRVTLISANKTLRQMGRECVCALLSLKGSAVVCNSVVLASFKHQDSCLAQYLSMLNICKLVEEQLAVVIDRLFHVVRKRQLLSLFGFHPFLSTYAGTPSDWTCSSLLAGLVCLDF